MAGVVCKTGQMIFVTAIILNYLFDKVKLFVIIVTMVVNSGRGKIKDCYVGLRLPAVTKRELAKIAARQDMSVSQYIRMLLNEYTISSRIKKR